MKKIVVFLILLVSLIPQRAQTKNVNWVALQSDTAAISAVGQLIVVTLNGSLNVPINGAGLVLRYDPTCFRVTSHHPGNLLTGAVIFAQAQPGQFDLTYRFHGSGQGQTGEGSLIAIQLEALKLCASDLSIAPDTVSLMVWGADGMASKLAGVEYRGLTLHLTQGQAPAATKASVLQTTQIQHLQLPGTDSTPLFFLMLTFLPIISAIIYFFLLRRSNQSRKLMYGSATLSKVVAKLFSKQTADKKGA